MGYFSDYREETLDFVVKYGGGIPMVCTVLICGVVSIVCFFFTISNLHLRGFFFTIFHKKIFGKPSTDDFNRQWIQHFIAHFSIGEMTIFLLFVTLNVVWFLFPLREMSVMDFSLHAWINASGRLALLSSLFVLFPAHRLSVLRLIFGLGVDHTLKYHKMLGISVLSWTGVHFFLCVAQAFWDHTSAILLGWNLEKFFNQPLPGTIAGIAVLLLCILSWEKIRVKYYTFFYYCHMFTSTVFVIFLVLHRNQIIIGVVAFAICFTLLDFMYRFCQNVLYPSKIVDIELYEKFQLVRIEIDKKFFLTDKVAGFPKFHVGQFVWVYIFHPKFFLMAHPFSLADSSLKKNIVLYIKKRKGNWTTKFYNMCKDNPEKAKKLMLGINGPFGTPFKYDHDDIYDRVVLVADGVCGTAILFGVLRDLRMKKSPLFEKATYYLLIRTKDYLEVFKRDIEEFQKSGALKIHYVGFSKRNMYCWRGSEKDVELSEEGFFEKDFPENKYVKKGPPNFKNEFQAYGNAQRIGIFIMGSERLLNQVKRDTYHLHYKKDLHFFEPVYQM